MTDKQSVTIETTVMHQLEKYGTTGQNLDISKTRIAHPMIGSPGMNYTDKSRLAWISLIRRAEFVTD